jgi:hypothetical protein
MYTHNKPQGNDVVDCSFYIDNFFRCVTLGHQCTHYYRTGEVDECKGLMKNIYTCFKAKAKADEHEARRIIKNDIIRSVQVIEPVWEYKKTPSWD